jgi:hypothetical protein
MSISTSFGGSEKLTTAASIPTSALHWELGNYSCRLDSAPCIGPEISFHHLNQPFVGLAYQCKDIVLRFIIEYTVVA